MGETLLIGLTLLVMAGILVIAIIPFVPGPALMWLVAVVFGFVNGFERLSVPVLVFMTVLMILGSTTELWTPMFGMRGEGASCWSILGTILGGIVGTFVIPIPVCGTFVGAMLGAVLFEFLRMGNIRAAASAGRLAVKSIMLSLVVEFGFSILILAVFIISLLLTG